ncbi:MAG TPA: hypothetical protein VMZ01_01000, partial [Aestuariivirga sp.]|nr:hypothetical protein [Aestuariivirga sp.]
LRKRELKVHGEMRALAAEQLRRQLESERTANAQINRIELRQRAREMRVHRRLAKLAEQQQENTIEVVPLPLTESDKRPKFLVPGLRRPISRPPSQQ